MTQPKSMTLELWKKLQPGDLVMRMPKSRWGEIWNKVVKVHPRCEGGIFWTSLDQKSSPNLEEWDYHDFFQNFYVRDGIKHTS